MKSITHGANARDNLLHIEADGVLVNIRVGLEDIEGHRVTAISISPDDDQRGGDAEGRKWYRDGDRIIRLHVGESPPKAKPGALSDREALDQIATLLGDAEDWTPATEFLDAVANIVGQTDRPSVGDQHYGEYAKALAAQRTRP